MGLTKALQNLGIAATRLDNAEAQAELESNWGDLA
jgi:hypothetical protein